MKNAIPYIFTSKFGYKKEYMLYLIKYSILCESRISDHLKYSFQIKICSKVLKHLLEENFQKIFKIIFLDSP